MKAGNTARARGAAARCRSAEQRAWERGREEGFEPPREEKEALKGARLHPRAPAWVLGAMQELA